MSLKAPLNNPGFTGTVSGITKAMIGLGNVDNTSDLNKPISTAMQTALNSKEDHFHVAFRAYGVGGVIRSYGLVPITGGDIDTSGGNGNYKITMSTPHPLGPNYGIIVTATNGAAVMVSSSVISSTQFTVFIFNSAGTPANAQFTCVVIG